ncbi:hypothetical protein HOU03_gp535 [Caulobacter phage CcrSC]|uniref:Uncharacterized protein n=1 Tax=Caulobacter phage CcrSC TaxID=2283272 RepID=A0A385EFU2_9CAUD|nr:hypothetical protein HOU03_gp535 [Caulobacter phage CcrSC]AXQ69732.1 hypothetical protein CcrSC_gp150 [Caulobacter phage CcrSC]
MAHATERPPEAASEETEQTPRRMHAMKTLIEHLRQAQIEAEAERNAHTATPPAKEA